MMQIPLIAALSWAGKTYTERLATLGIMGDQLRARLKTSQYDSAVIVHIPLYALGRGWSDGLPMSQALGKLYV